MTGFEALFAFYALLLGLAIANVSTAFADMYSRRAQVPVGLTVPLLGLVVILAASQQWMSLFGAQSLTLDGATVLTSLAMALPYIVIGRLMVPRHGGTASLESHYAQHRLLLAGMLLVPVLTSFVNNATAALAADSSLADGLAFFAFYHGLRVLIIVPMLVWPSRWVQRAGLAALGLWTLVMMLAR